MAQAAPAPAASHPAALPKPAAAKPAPAQQSRAGKFVMGGLSGMIATCFVQPMDLIKNRMQLSGEGGGKKVHKTAFHAIFNIIKQEGAAGLYNGLSAGLLRQALYTTTRLGVYQWLEDSFGAQYGTNVFAKLAMGMTAGGIGAVVGNPAEVVLVRMTADGRAMVLNAAQLGGYSQAKVSLLKTGFFKDDVYLHFAASLVAGFLSTAVSIPIDISKTRLQTMKADANGVYPYKGTTDVLSKVVRTEGALALWKGFTPYFLRLGPHTIITFIALEQMKKNWSF